MSYLTDRPYPIRRTLPLVEAISRDFNDQLLRTLGSQRLMYMDYTKFEEQMAMVADVFGTWDENMKDFTNVAREGRLGFPREGHAELYSVPKASRKVHINQNQPGPRAAARAYSVPASVQALSRAAACHD